MSLILIKILFHKLIPQILFSEFAIPDDAFAGWLARIRQGMPVYWAYEMMKQGASTETNWLQVFLSLGMLFLIGTLLGLFSRLALVSRQEVV